MESGHAAHIDGRRLSRASSVTDPQKQPGIAVGQVFLEEATFSHRPDALALPPSTRPQVGEVGVEIQAGIRPDGKAGLLRVRVATKDDAEPLYRVSLVMVGLFEEQPELSNMPLQDFLNGPAISFMYPFVREAFASLTGRGRFGPVWLNPFNAHAAGVALAEASTKTKEPERRLEQ